MFALCHSSITLPPSRNSARSLCAFLRTVTHRDGGILTTGVTMKHSYICEVCGNGFVDTSRGRRFCSVGCAGKYRYLTSTNTPDRFWKLVEVKGPDECWEWKRGVNGPYPYGRLRFRGKRMLASRLAFELTNGHPPDNWVLHKCDNPRCCNPAHLYDGTPKDNVRDCILRGRHKTPGWLKLSSVVGIKQRLKDGANYKAIALEFHLLPETIRDIELGRTWRHV